MSRKKIAICNILVILTTCLFLVRDAFCSTLTQGVESLKLDNGITVLVKENHSAPVASLQVWVATGSADEYEKEAGITHFIEHMIFKGTPRRMTGEIARAIEESGGHINAYTSLDRTVYHVEIASRHMVTAVDVLMDALQNSLFDPEEIEREREVILEEYRRSIDMPQRRFYWSLMGLAFSKHPYRRPIIGYEQTIKAVKRDDIISYVNRRYLPENIVIVAVGDFDSKEIIKALKIHTREFPKRSGGGKEKARVQEPEQKALRSMVMAEDVQHASFSLSWHIPSVDHPDMPVLDLLAGILAHGRSSRLNDRLRMKNRLVHSIEADTLSTLDQGLFSISSRLDPANLLKVLEALAEEISDLSTTPVSGEELAKAKALAEADFLMEMETMSGQARTLGFFHTACGNFGSIDKYLDTIRSATEEDISRVASKYLRPEKISAGLMRPRDSKVEFSEQKLLSIFSRKAGGTGERHGKVEGASVRKVILPGGIRLLLKENRDLPLVSVTGAFLGGSRLEMESPWGISKVASEMLTRGTGRRSAADIASLVETKGGSLSAFSGQNALGISASFLSKDLYPGLELLADLLADPSFPESELEKVKADLIAAVREKKDHPTPQLFDLFYKTLFREHPYGHPQTGTEDTVRSITREELLKWYRMIADPSRFVIAIVGDMESRQVASYVESLFLKSAFVSTPLQPVSRESPIKTPRIAHLERPGAQVHMVVGYLAGDLKSPDDASMAIVETALSGLGGRLFLQLRDKESLAYSVTAFRRPGIDAGFFGIYLACDPSKVSAAKESIFRELNLLKEKGLSSEELKGAKQYLLGNMVIDLQRNSSQASRMALDELYGLGYDHLERFMERIDKVSIADVKRAIGDIVLEDNYVLVTAGPGSAFR